MSDDSTETITRRSEDGSPFARPPVTSGYPLDEREEKTIERILREQERERDGTDQVAGRDAR
jgi:hypothetical protein